MLINIHKIIITLIISIIFNSNSYSQSSQLIEAFKNSKNSYKMGNLECVA